MRLSHQKLYIACDIEGNVIPSSEYTVTVPSGRKNVGKYTYVVDFKDDYAGTVELSMKIRPAKTSVKELVRGSRSFTAKWVKNSSLVTGYQVQYVANKDFSSSKKTVSVKSYKTTSKTVKYLKAKKKYYVRVRTYKIVDGIRYYSQWSQAKAVITR